LHFPGSHLHRTLSGILPYEARTFLTCTNAAAIIYPAYTVFADHRKHSTPALFRQINFLGSLHLILIILQLMKNIVNKHDIINNAIQHKIQGI